MSFNEFLASECVRVLMTVATVYGFSVGASMIAALVIDELVKKRSLLEYDAIYRILTWAFWPALNLVVTAYWIWALIQDRRNHPTSHPTSQRSHS